jgi:hypothetical protein
MRGSQQSRRASRLGPKTQHSPPSPEILKNGKKIYKNEKRYGGIIPYLDLTESLTQCRQYHREHLSNVSKIGDLTCGGQKESVPSYAKSMRVRERNHSRRALSPSLFSPISLI